MGKVSSMQSRTYDIVILDSIRLAPGAHDPRIIKSSDGHDIHALLLQRGQILNVSWEMVLGTGRSECAGHGDQDDLLIGPLFTFTSTLAVILYTDSQYRG